MSNEISRIAKLYSGTTKPSEVTQTDEQFAREFSNRLDGMIPGWVDVLPADSPLLKKFQEEAVEAATSLKSEIDTAIGNEDWESAQVLGEYLANQMSRELGATHDVSLEARLVYCRLLSDQLGKPELASKQAKDALNDLEDANHKTVPEFCLQIVQTWTGRGESSELLPFLNRGIAAALELGMEKELIALIEIRTEMAKGMPMLPNTELRTRSTAEHQRSTSSAHQLLVDSISKQLPQQRNSVDELLNGLTEEIDQLLESTTLAAALPAEKLAKFITDELEPTCISLGNTGAEVWQLLHDKETRDNPDRVSTVVMYLSSVFSQFRDVSVEDMVLLVVATVDLLTQDE